MLLRARKRVAAVVAMGIDRALEVASMFDDAAQALDVDMAGLLAELQPMSTPLDQYAALIAKIRAAQQAVRYAAPTEVWTGLLLVDTSPLKTSLGARADHMVEALLNQLLSKSVEAYQHICARCEAISNEVMAVAQDTPGVLGIKEKLGSGEAEVEQLKGMANAAKDRDMFRLAYRHAESLDQSFAQLAFDAQNWPRDMLLVFSTAWEKVEAEYTHFQGALKRKRETLRKELKEVAVLVEAYKDVVDASELVGELAKELEPYASLWQVVSEYALRSEDWLYGNMQGLNPEEVEELTGEWYKRMQRLAKSMQLAEHRRLAEESRVKLEGFKALLPIISAVCNPGMRGRHWDALSKV
ncbi:uncharacterized protein HaLaN_10266, partial [Haematococcus lacustris]